MIASNQTIFPARNLNSWPSWLLYFVVENFEVQVASRERDARVTDILNDAVADANITKGCCFMTVDQPDTPTILLGAIG